MPDLMDGIQELQLRELEAANAVRTAPRRGPSACVECDERISEARRDLGADRCVECQAAEEGRLAHLRKWGAR